MSFVSWLKYKIREKYEIFPVVCFFLPSIMLLLCERTVRFEQERLRVLPVLLLYISNDGVGLPKAATEEMAMGAFHWFEWRMMDSSITI
jgi:hypothetical protein